MSIAEAYDQSSGPKTPQNPSRKAVKRVANPLPVPTTCHYCGGDVKCDHHNDVYGQEYGDWPWMYRCQNTACGAYVGLHQFTNIPLGTLANKALRDARHTAKNLFNPIWQGFKYVERRRIARTKAYEWLAGQLNIPTAECHFAWFDLPTCYLVMEILSTTDTSKVPV